MVAYFQACEQADPRYRWLRIYSFLIVAVIPAVLFFVVNVLILSYVRSSTRRVLPSSTTQPALSVRTRDMRLVKSMAIIFSLFVIGWGPVYVLITFYEEFKIPFEILKLLAQFILFGDIINLYLYNREVRLYLRQCILNYMHI